MKERGPLYVKENKPKLKFDKYKVAKIKDYYAGSKEEPINHGFVTLSGAKFCFCFKI